MERTSQPGPAQGRDLDRITADEAARSAASGGIGSDELDITGPSGEFATESYDAAHFGVADVALGEEDSEGTLAAERTGRRADTGAASAEVTHRTALEHGLRRFVLERPIVAVGGALVAGFLVGRILSR